MFGVDNLIIATQTHNCHIRISAREFTLLYITRPILFQCLTAEFPQLLVDIAVYSYYGYFQEYTLYVYTMSGENCALTHFHNSVSYLYLVYIPQQKIMLVLNMRIQIFYC